MNKNCSEKRLARDTSLPALQQQNDFLLELSDVTAEMLNQTDLDELLQNIAERLLRLSGGCCSYIALASETGEYLELKYSSSKIGEVESSIILPRTGIGGTAWSEKRVVCTTDYANYDQRLCTEDIFKQGCAIPLDAQGGGGVLCIFYSDETADIEAQLDPLQRFACIAAAAIDNARAHDKQRTEVSMLETMLHINQAIDESSEIITIMQSVCKRIVKGFKANRARIYSYSDSQFNALAGQILSNNKIVEDKTLPDQAILSQSANKWTIKNLLAAHVRINVDDERETELVHKHRRDVKIGCSYIVPLLCRGEAWGVLSIHKGTGQPDFDFSETRMIDLLASQLSVAINRQELLQEIKFQADHDQLTGCVSRGHFEEKLDIHVRHAQSTDDEFAILYIDLDGFKNINDTMGHDTGDLVLVHVAKLIEEAKSHDMCVARLGGDEFAILTPIGYGHKETIQLGQTIVDRLSVNRTEDEFMASVGASVGIARYPFHARVANKLLTCADIAMYHAKASGRSQVREYDQEFADNYTRKISLKSRVEHAVANDEFELYYQPKVSAITGLVEGAEALIRWNEPDFVSVSPAEWIPLAEEVGVISEIGRWVGKNAIRYLEALREQGIDLKLSVNISATQFDARYFPDRAIEDILESNIPPSNFEFEITESALINDVDVAVEKLRQLRATGIRIAIDDFGVKYSSLAYLADLPIDVVKVDREFVRRLDNGSERSMLEPILVLAKTLGLKTVVEGVETAEQLQRVKSFGCDCIQGYYYSRPVPGSELPGVIQAINDAAGKHPVRSAA